MKSAHRALPALVFLLWAVPGFAGDDAAARLLAGDGLDSVLFTTAAGTVRVNLPDDLAAGGAFSFSVFANSAPGEAEAAENNLKTLASFKVAVGGSSPVSPQAWGKWTVPAGFIRVNVALLDAGGKTLGHFEVPLAQADPGTGAEAPLDFLLPEAGQAGRPVVIPGAFDGDFATTRLTINGEPVVLYAESTHELVAAAAAPGKERATGPGSQTLNENGREKSGEYRNVSIGLDAPRLDLRSGETTPMTVTVHGLKNLKQPMKLRIVNHSVTVVKMEAGDDQSVKIEPKTVDGEGNYRLTRTLTGIRPGEFDIQATVHPELLDGMLEMESSWIYFLLHEPGVKFRLSLDGVPLSWDPPVALGYTPVIGENKVSSGSHHLDLKMSAGQTAVCVNLTVAAPQDQPDYRLRALSFSNRRQNRASSPSRQRPTHTTHLQDLRNLTKGYDWELRGVIYDMKCEAKTPLPALSEKSRFHCVQHHQDFNNLDELIRHLQSDDFVNVAGN